MRFQRTYRRSGSAAPPFGDCVYWRERNADSLAGSSVAQLSETATHVSTRRKCCCSVLRGLDHLSQCSCVLEYTSLGGRPAFPSAVEPSTAPPRCPAQWRPTGFAPEQGRPVLLVARRDPEPRQSSLNHRTLLEGPMHPQRNRYS